MRLYSAIGVTDIQTTAKYPYCQFPLVILCYLVIILSDCECSKIAQKGMDLNHNFYVVVGKQCRTENGKTGHQYNIQQ